MGMYWLKPLQKHQFEFTLKDTVLAATSMILVSLSIISYSYAVKYGTPSTCQAIENIRSIVQMLLGIVLMKLVPNYFQVIGLVIGFAAILMIVR